MNDRQDAAMSRNAVFVSLLSLLLISTACQTEQTESTATGSVSSALVGGIAESGWLGVGALTVQYPGYGYAGSFCTATLIDSQWLLTAAHCLTEHEDMEITPELTMFYTGTDARPSDDGWPETGTLYQTDAFYVHPSYDADTQENDIGLVHLSEPATSVPAYPFNVANLSSYAGQTAFYVGFGVTEGVTSTGGGIKRSGDIDILQMNGSTSYLSEFEGVGVCFGDSGGPGLLQIGGEWRVVGINSGVSSSSSSDPCQGYSFHTRVDMFASWISGIVGTELPTCQEEPGLCSCDDACQADGTCDNSACQLYDCQEAYTCLTSCDSTDTGCQNDCYVATTDVGREALDAMLICFSEHCADATTDAAYQQCVQDNCSTEVDTCFPVVAGDLSCEEMYDCLVACPQGDSDCQQDCFDAGTTEAQTTLNDMYTCFEDSCGDIEDADEWQTCIFDHCVAEIDGCFPPDNCDIRGGDCPAGAACYPTGSGATNCYLSDELALGADCSTDSENLPCDDGLICLGNETEKYCFAFCLEDGDCDNLEACAAPIFTGVEDIGACVCADDDEDGYCVQHGDCDDTDANVHPDAEELCDDTVDNDCDGETDEGCAVCTDVDEDGYCAEGDDCDDTNANVYAGAEELCGDGLDNDCDGSIDEDCVVCTDVDNDGHCLEGDDCDDGNANIFAGAAELCDTVDNDCDGEIDEGCVVCTDIDNDEHCAEDGDCDDTNPNIFGGAAELCDTVDNDCDGEIDEGCAMCTDLDEDGHCAEDDDCDDDNADVHTGAPELCDAVDNDCDGDVDEGCVVCTDVDEDQHCAEDGDCDDHNPAVYFGADERCDGLDNDCDGQVDEGCVVCTDVDEDGYCAEDADCNDTDALIYAGAEELCDDGVDNDCDGRTDEGCIACTDADQDDHCVEDGDCDDTNPLVYAGAEERCDTLDNDCDGVTDEGCVTCTDNDQDGYCAEDDDCDDTNPAVYSGALERCGDGLDNDCDGETDEGCVVCTDIDRDGYCAEDADCNDTNPNVNNGANERCGDAIDNDCDGDIDEGCVTCTDADQDGYCAEDNDCDDQDGDAHPGAEELCDGVDNDCNDLVDEGCPTCTDLDHDGHCAGYDCDDGNSDINPFADEVCGDLVDNNCDGQTDEGCEGDDPEPGQPEDGGCSTGGPSNSGGLLIFLLLLATAVIRGRRTQA